MYLCYFTTHPMIFSLILVGLSGFVGIIYYIKIAIWIFYSITLVFLGGIIVLFLYVSILRNEDKIVYKGPGLFTRALTRGLIITFSLEESLVKARARDWEFSILGELYKNYTVGNLCILIFYLLLTLFTTIKFTEGFKGTILKVSW